MMVQLCEVQNKSPQELRKADASMSQLTALLVSFSQCQSWKLTSEQEGLVRRVKTEIERYLEQEAAFLTKGLQEAVEKCRALLEPSWKQGLAADMEWRRPLPECQGQHLGQRLWDEVERLLEAQQRGDARHKSPSSNFSNSCAF